ncbi:hypothetical protein [Paracoccus spongiarum]|uniref:DUF4169 family protein n=1 Tax=Paracoccus spongiarum TaxID=3064387 RepID=A0ABT9J8C0_9RHOB|nr:hypothetical protein [Paracoccus sp. 2205BS29-5]MDP5306054.1 hypothetical protein [Paracoccus sp. 2205BS29-5]
MSDDRPGTSDGKAAREARLRAALRANLQRRKAQARARAAEADGDDNSGSETGGDDS